MLLTFTFAGKSWKSPNGGNPIVNPQCPSLSGLFLSISDPDLCARMCSCKPQWAKVRESELNLGIERKSPRVKVPSGCFTVVSLSSLGKV